MLTQEQKVRFDKIRQRRDSVPPTFKGREISSALSPRELQIVRMVADGIDDHAIGAALIISPLTVGGHKQRAKLKLGAATIPQMVGNAFLRGYLTANGAVDLRCEIEHLENALLGLLEQIDDLRHRAV